MSRPNPLAVPLTTAAVIAELRLAEADVSPEARRAAARAAAAAMTPAQRAGLAERNADKYAVAESKVKYAAYLMTRER